MTDPVITEIAQKHGRTPAQVCINWALQRNTIPLTKTVNLDRLTENFQSFDFEMSPEEVQKINDLDAGIRIFQFNAGYFS